jgi:isopenicillin-N epimerase
MSLSRRDFLTSAGALAAVASVGPLAACAQSPASAPWRRGGRDGWSEVRDRIPVSRDYVHLAGLLIASHPLVVREAVEAHRSGLDANPTLYLDEHRRRLEREARRAAAEYMGARMEEIALTDSTTMGIGLVYNGISVRPDQEMLVSRQDYYSTREALRLRAARTGSTVREITLFERVETVTEDEIVDSVLSAVTPATRVVAATWVHSSTGLKFPVRRVADGLARLNAGRSPEDRALLCVDGVHGFGVENFQVSELGCDFFMAGTHKWIFGPRGTGILWGNPETAEAVTPTIPSFNQDGSWGGAMSPGGFKPFEHQWAVAEAFRFHREIGKGRVAQRIHELARQANEGLRAMSHVHVYTPLEPRLSAGIVCFDVEGMHPNRVVERLLERNVIASVTPYSPSHARVTPGLLNDPGEIDYMLEVVAGLRRAPLGG